MAEVTSNQSIVKLDCGHDKSDVFYVHKCLRTFCRKCKLENRSCVLCKSQLLETDYLKAIDRKKCEDDSICNNQAIFQCLCGKKYFCEDHLFKFHRPILPSKRCCAVILSSDLDDQPCSICNNRIAEFVDNTTNELFCASCNQNNNSVNIVPIERDNNNNDTDNPSIAKNVEIYCADVRKRLDLLNNKIKDYTIEIENEKAEFNKGIGHMRSKLESYLSVNKTKTDSLRAEVTKVKQFSNQLNRSDKFGITDLIKSNKLNNKLADSKLKLWVDEIVQSYVIPELTKSGVDWTKESERAFHELVPGLRNWKLNHGPFFPDNFLKLTYDLIKEQIFHRTICRASSCYCEQNSLTKKFYDLKTECKLSQNNLDYFLDCSSIAGGCITLLIETGKRALNQSDFIVAEVCFEEAHRISPNNWIALDTLMGLYFVLNDFSNCLKLAIKGLTADCNYFKARVLISEILKSTPTLKSEIPVDLDYLIDCSSADDLTRKTKILDKLNKTKQLRDGEKKTETQQENVRKSLLLDLNIETISLQSLISALIVVNSEIEKQKLNLSTFIPLKITGNPLSNPLSNANTISSKRNFNQNNKRKSQGHDPSAKRKSGEDLQPKDPIAISMYEKIFTMLPESILTREIVQEEEVQVQTKNEAQVEHLILTRYLSKQIPFVAKGKQIHLLILDLLYEIASEATAVRLPSNFMDLYRIYRKWYPLPTPLTCSIMNIDVGRTNLILIANEVEFNQPEAIFLTESIPYLRDLMITPDYDKFFIRLLILRGIKETKVDYLLMANEMFTKINLKSVQTANQTIYTSFSLRSMINKMNENNLDTLLDQHRHEEIVELLASKSELSKQEEGYLCQAIQSSQYWKRGIEIIARSKQLTDTLLNLLRSCLKNGHGTSIDRELAIKLLKLGTEDYNVMAWTCILQTFINEMRCGHIDEGQITYLINSIHEYLGSEGVCCHSNGEFLSLSLDYSINQSTILREKLILSCLGCFYKQLECNFLSAHPESGVSLHWKDMNTIYNHFIPKTLPTFDSEKCDSINANTAELLLKLLSKVPENLNPERFSNSVKEYVDHGKSIEPSSSIPKDHVTRDLYYYLADYYFKNEEFQKAVQFYFLDLSLNLNRFDSWAGCALAITSQIDQSSSTNGRVFSSSAYNPLNFWNKAFRCFNKATPLKDNESKIWLEYGKCAYNIASYISRAMKFGPVLENSQKEEIKKQRKRFLDQARVCFESAHKFSNVDEIMMNYYFLGKIAERSNISEALRYYELSLSHFVSSEATGINVPNSIQHRFGIEIHYRIHAYALKYIHRDKILSSKILEVLTRAEKSITLFDSASRNNKTIDDTRNGISDLSTVESEDQRLNRKIINLCREAMLRILRCSPGHYKALYQMAHLHYLSEDFLKTRKILTEPFEPPTHPQSSTTFEIGDNSTETVKSSPIQDLFDPTKCNYYIFHKIQKTSNIFIERPGSFCTHIRRLTDLLIDVNKTLGDAEQLLRIAIFLNSLELRSKGYLRENDRENLGKKALELCFSIYESRVMEAKGNHQDLKSIEANLREICNKLMEYPFYEHSAKKFLEKHDNRVECITID